LWYAKIKLLYTIITNWKPFFNIFYHRRDFPAWMWHEKIRFFTPFQLQTALESRKPHQMTWNLASKSTFMSSTRKNYFGMDIRNIDKIKVNGRFFSIFSHSVVSLFVFWRDKIDMKWMEVSKLLRKITFQEMKTCCVWNNHASAIWSYHLLALSYKYLFKKLW